LVQKRLEKLVATVARRWVSTEFHALASVATSPSEFRNRFVADRRPYPRFDSSTAFVPIQLNSAEPDSVERFEIFMCRIRRQRVFLFNRIPALLAAGVLVQIAITGCAPPPPQTAGPHEDLDGTAWIQTSAEYGALTRQTYRSAIDRLEQARNDPKWSAIPAQAKLLSTMPADAKAKLPAVILDVDETVLDNSGYQAGLVESGEGYSRESWEAWANAGVAEPIPGAKTFLDVCRASGVTVFFVTNRENKLESATRANLEDHGLIQPDDPDTILSKRERDAWGSDKEPRRVFIAKHYRVLLLLGDDFNDFIWAGKHPTPAERRALADKHEAYWGEKWFVLPNPSYGGWERALYGFDDALPRGEKLFFKRDHLRTVEELQEAAEKLNSDEGAEDAGESKRDAA